MRKILALGAMALMASAFYIAPQAADAQSFGSGSGRGWANSRRFGSSCALGRCEYDGGYGFGNRRFDRGNGFGNRGYDFAERSFGRGYAFGNNRFNNNFSGRRGDIDQLQARLQNRITRGLESGRLSQREATRLQNRYNQIASLEDRLRFSGNGLNFGEQQRLGNQLNSLLNSLRGHVGDFGFLGSW